MKNAFLKKMTAAIAAVTVAATAAINPVAAFAATNTAASAAAVMGDLTGDGIVDIYDAIKVAEIIAFELVGLENDDGTYETLLKGDVDNDGAVSINDLAYILVKFEREQLLGEQHFFFPAESPHPYGVWYTAVCELVLHDAILGDEYATMDAGGVAFLEKGEEFTITEYCGDAWYLVHTNNLRKDMYVQIPESAFVYLCQPSPMG